MRHGLQVTEFAGKYCAKQGSTQLDVDALLDAELERRTAVGIQMANMLARGQVIPVRMILEVAESARACSYYAVRAGSDLGTRRLYLFRLYHFWLYQFGCTSVFKSVVDTFYFI